MFKTFKTTTGHIYTVYIAGGRVAFRSSAYRLVSTDKGLNWVG